MYVICQSLILLIIGNTQVASKSHVEGYVIDETDHNYVVDFTAYVGIQHPHMSNLERFRRMTISKRSCSVLK